MSDKFSISSMFANIVLSAHNQSTSMITVGPIGSGKSNASLKIAYETAREIARRTGKGEWQDYFNMNHVAVITHDEILNLVRNMGKKHGVYLFDDIGVGLNARLWQKRTNQLLNNIFQVVRTTNTLILFSVPEDNFIDKVARNLVKFRLEMEPESNRMDMGLTFGKFLRVKHMPRLAKTHHVYPTEANRKIIRVAIPRAPDVLINEYEEKRTRIANELIQEHMDEFEGLINGMDAPDKKPKEKKISKKQQILTAIEGLTTVKEQDEALKMVGINRKEQYVRNVITNNV